MEVQRRELKLSVYWGSELFINYLYFILITVIGSKYYFTYFAQSYIAMK